MLITPEPGIRSTIKIRNKKGESFHFETVPLMLKMTSKRLEGQKKNSSRRGSIITGRKVALQLGTNTVKRMNRG